MTKALAATCVLGVVSIDGSPLASATVLSEGVGQSGGVALLDEDQVYYLPKGSPDLKTTLTQISSALQHISAALSAIDAKPTGGSGSAPTPAAAADILAVTAAKTALDTLKGAMI